MVCVLSVVSSLTAMVSRLEMIAKQRGFELFLHTDIAPRLTLQCVSNNHQGKYCIIYFLKACYSSFRECLIHSVCFFFVVVFFELVIYNHRRQLMDCIKSSSYVFFCTVFNNIKPSMIFKVDYFLGFILSRPKIATVAGMALKEMWMYFTIRKKRSVVKLIGTLRCAPGADVRINFNGIIVYYPGKPVWTQSLFVCFCTVPAEITHLKLCSSDIDILVCVPHNLILCWYFKPFWVSLRCLWSSTLTDSCL